MKNPHEINALKVMWSLFCNTTSLEIAKKEFRALKESLRDAVEKASNDNINVNIRFVPYFGKVRIIMRDSHNPIRSKRIYERQVQDENCMLWRTTKTKDALDEKSKQKLLKLFVKTAEELVKNMPEIYRESLEQELNELFTTCPDALKPTFATKYEIN